MERWGRSRKHIAQMNLGEMLSVRCLLAVFVGWPRCLLLKSHSVEIQGRVCFFCRLAVCVLWRLNSTPENSVYSSNLFMPRTLNQHGPPGRSPPAASRTARRLSFRATGRGGLRDTARPTLCPDALLFRSPKKWSLREASRK